MDGQRATSLFVKFTNANKDARQVLSLVGHHSHKTLKAVLYAREQGIDMITLPSHCTHKMQPLDETFFKSLKRNYNVAANNLMVSNTGIRIAFYDMQGASADYTRRRGWRIYAFLFRGLRDEIV